VRVSEVLSMFYNFVGIDRGVLDAKAKIGTEVHEAIVEDCRGEFHVFAHDRARAYYESYVKWRPEKLVIDQIPRLYDDELMLTGEIDGLLDGSTLIDWKCSATPNEKVWNMQAHLYWYLLTQNGYKINDNMLWINLCHNKEKKALPARVFEFSFDQDVLSICIDAVTRYWEEKSSCLDLT